MSLGNNKKTYGGVMMKKTIIVVLLMTAVSLMTFAGGFGLDSKGQLTTDAQEIVQLEKEYQLVSLLNYTGFTKAQLEEIIAAVEETQADIAKLEEDVAEDLADAVELAKAGDSEKAAEAHDTAVEKAQELATIKDEFTTTVKGLITVEQQEKMMQYAMQTAMNGMKQGRDFAGKMTDSEVQGRNGQTAETIKNNVKDVIMSSERFQQLPEAMQERAQQFAGNLQRGVGNSMQTVRQTTGNRNASTMFFGALLNEDNLEIVKDYAAGLTE